MLGNAIASEKITWMTEMVLQNEILSFHRDSNHDACNGVSHEDKILSFHVRIKSTLFREREKLETARLLNGGSGVGEKYQILNDYPNSDLILTM